MAAVKEAVASVPSQRKAFPAMVEASMGGSHLFQSQLSGSLMVSPCKLYHARLMLLMNSHYYIPTGLFKMLTLSNSSIYNLSI